MALNIPDFKEPLQACRSEDALENIDLIQKDSVLPFVLSTSIHSVAVSSVVNSYFHMPCIYLPEILHNQRGSKPFQRKCVN